MKKKNSTPSWNAEARRQERKDRLAELRGKDGQHRVTTTTRSPRSWLTLAVVVILLLAVLAYAGVSMGLPQRLTPIMVVDGQKITVAQFNYWYGNLLGQYGLDPSSEELGQTISTDAEGVETRLFDYMVSTCATQLQRIYTEAALAEDEGITLGEYQDSVDAQIDSIIASSGSAGLADMMLKQVYGPGSSIGAVRELYEKLYLSTKFAATRTAAADVSKEALDKYYVENKADIDEVTYRAFSFSFAPSSTATSAEAEAAKKSAKTKADAFLNGVKSEADFKKLALEATPEEDRKTYEEGDKSLVKGVTSASLTEAVKTWMFDDTRTSGNKTVLENTTDYTVVYFLKREKPVNLQTSVRHILIAAAKDSATEAEIAAAKTKAEGILAQVTTEESFIALVRTNSADTASIADGGLYTGLDEDSSFVEEFLDWSIDPARKAGDTGIVQTTYGFHVMYFSQQLPAWENTVRTLLQSGAYEDFITEKLQDARFAYTINTSAVKYII